MVVPVLSVELLLGSRRNRLNAFRRVLAGWLMLQFFILFISVWQTDTEAGRGSVAIGPLVHITLRVFIAQQFLLLILATPAFVAGAITDEKSRGTLQHLLTTDLTSWEIIVGKYLGRIIQVGLLVLVGCPLICFIGGFGKVSLSSFLCMLLVACTLMFLLGSLSIWASVRCRQTREAVLRVYLSCGLAALAGWGIHEGIVFLLTKGKLAFSTRMALGRLDNVLCCLNPVYVLEPVWENHLAEFFRRFPPMFFIYGTVAIGSLGLAVTLFRRAYIRQGESAGRPRRRLGRTRKTCVVPDDPVCWRERRVGGWLARALGVVLVCALTAGSSWFIYRLGEPLFFLIQGLAALLLIGVVVGIRASGSVTSERERRTWESLLLTPMETWELLDDKLRGSLQSTYPYIFAFAIPALSFSLMDSFGAVIFTLSTLILAWITLYYMGATGIWCSARSKSSWRSLVLTLVSGYGYFLGILSLLGLTYLWLGCIIGPIVGLFLALAGVTKITFGIEIILCITSCLAMSWFLWRVSYAKVLYAESWVDENERYGRTFTRSLTSALKKHYQRLETERAQKGGSCLPLIPNAGPSLEHGQR